MECVAVTRGGAGDLWLFASRDAADEHPLVQFGDVIATSGQDVADQYSALELQILAERLELQGIARLDLEKIFDRMVTLARQPPDDGVEVCRIVSADRRTTRRSTMAEAATKVKAEKPKTVAGFGMKSTITLGSSKDRDKEGKETGGTTKFGPKNNPKREGSASATRFALYKDGQTIEKAIAAGITASDIAHDSKTGLITIQAVA